MTDYKVIQAAVADTIEAVVAGDGPAVMESLEKLSAIQSSSVLAELFLWIEDLTAEHSFSELAAVATLPFPPNAEAIVDACLKHDLPALMVAVGSKEVDRLFASVIAVVAVLKDASERLDG